MIVKQVSYVNSGSAVASGVTTITNELTNQLLKKDELDSYIITSVQIHSFPGAKVQVSEKVTSTTANNTTTYDLTDPIDLVVPTNGVLSFGNKDYELTNMKYMKMDSSSGGTISHISSTPGAYIIINITYAEK